MNIDAPVAPPTLPAGVRIELFTDETRVRDAVAVNAEAYQTLGLPASEVHAFFGCPHRLLSPRIAGFVAYRDGQPLSTALTVMSAHAAGVDWVDTANAGRRMGLADACTRLATNAGFARGAGIVTLQASKLGEPLYRRLGYRTFDTTKRYLHPAPT